MKCLFQSMIVLQCVIPFIFISFPSLIHIVYALIRQLTVIVCGGSWSLPSMIVSSIIILDLGKIKQLYLNKVQLNMIIHRVRCTYV